MPDPSNANAPSESWPKHLLREAESALYAARQAATNDNTDQAEALNRIAISYMQLARMEEPTDA